MATYGRLKQRIISLKHLALKVVAPRSLTTGSKLIANEPASAGEAAENSAARRLDFRRSLVSGLPSGEERGLISRTAAGNRAYAARRMAYAKKFSIGIEKCKCKV